MRRSADDLPAERLLAIVASLCVAALAVALVSQHRFGLQPCPWCVLQRVLLLAIALACVPGLIVRSRGVQTACAWLAAFWALCGIGAALWQHFRAAASASCSLTLADKIVGSLRLDSALPEVFEPRASCADAAVSLLGVPYDFWSLALFVVIALLAAQGARR